MESFCSNPTHSTFLLAHSVAFKRSFKKKASQGSKNKTKKYGSFGLGLSSAEGNRKMEV
jgi:hypothetical protein